jgi:hypothetical protein
MPILTRRLREFLESPESFSPGYRRVLKHVLKSRISAAMKELEYIGEKLPELLDEIGLDSLACGRSGVRIPPVHQFSVQSPLEALQRILSPI